MMRCRILEGEECNDDRCQHARQTRFDADCSASQSAAQQASSDTKEKITANTTPAEDEDQKKKRKQPSLKRRIGRVTVILPKA